MNLIFDIETNGLLHDLTAIHCIGIYDLASKESFAFNDVGGEPLTRGITMIEEACHIIGHNIINFDIPAIGSLYLDEEVKKYCYMWREGGQFSTEKYKSKKRSDTNLI